MILHAPIEIELKITVVSDKTDQIVVATIGMGKGKYPTQSELIERVTKYEAEEMPDDFRLCDKVEFFKELLANRGVPTNFAVPGGSDWDPIGSIDT